MVFLFSFFDVTERKKKFCGGIFRVDDDDNDSDSGLVVAPDMLPRLYFLFLTNFFLSSFFNFKYLCLFQYYFIKKLFVCVLFFLAALLLYIIWQRERKSVVRSVPSIFFFSLFCSMLWQFKTVFTASRGDKKDCFSFRILFFGTRSFLCCFHPPTIFDIVSRFTF